MNSVSRAFVLATTLLISAGVNGKSLSLADQYFADEKYEPALREYMSIANIGNPKAYYQLGVIHHNGHWVEKSFLESLIWFSLAAEYNYQDSKELANTLFAQVAEKQREEVASIVADYLLQFGKAAIKDKFYPAINTERLGLKIDHSDSSDRYIEEAEFEDFDDIEEIEEPSIDEEEEDDFGSDENLFGIGDSAPYSTLKAPHFLIADYDIEADGSRRNVIAIEKFGYVQNTLYALKSIGVAPPTFDGEPVAFIGRTYQGLANYEKALFRDKQPTLYRRILKALWRLEKDLSTPVNKYLYARTLMNITWLKSTDAQINQLLKESAEGGVVRAQFEYGLKLYREQDDIESAIYWLSEAARQTDPDAEYRLGKLILDSPWVVRDEKKALVWFESAANKKHPAASMQLINLRLMASDKSIRDTKEAIRRLDELGESQKQNPFYKYLRAVSHTKPEARQLSVAFKHMRSAIFLAKDLGWNTEEWEALLRSWTQGSITVQDL